MKDNKQEKKPQTTLEVPEPKQPVLQKDITSIGQALSQMEELKKSGVKVLETHDGLYYQERPQKKEQVLVVPNLMVAKKESTITITVADPQASPEKIMQETPFVPNQKMQGALAGKKSQSEVSRAKNKDKKKKK